MTIGPEPMTRMLSRSVRFGTVSAARFHELDELVEEVGGVVGAGGGLGVVLHGEGPRRSDPQALDDPVVEIHVGDGGAAGDRVGIDGVVVVLAGDLDGAGGQSP